MKKPYLTQYLVAAYRDSKSKKVDHYELAIMKVIPDGQTFKVEGKIIVANKCETIAGRIKITKEKAKKLMENGVEVSAGYFIN